MKYIQLFLLFLTMGFASQVTAQTFTLRTSSVSYSEKNQIGKWSKWSEFAKADLIITIDGKKNRIVVNSPTIQVFTIKKLWRKNGN